MPKLIEPVDEIKCLSDPEVASSTNLFLAELVDKLRESDGHQELTLTATLERGLVIEHEWKLKRSKLQ